MTNEEFAEKVRQEMNHILGSVQAGNLERIGRIAAEVCSMAARQKTHLQFQAQQDDPGRYDLASLAAVSAFDEE